MEKETCKTCKHFVQHYAFHEGKFHWVNCGHYTEPKCRHKKPHTKACEYYSHAEPAESHFVTKRYLSKELLEYMLRLELPPVIENTGDA